MLARLFATLEAPRMFDPEIQSVMDRVDGLRHQVDDHYQIPLVEARLLAQIVRLGRCVSLCEIGTSYGFSTLHLAAAAAEHRGHIHSIDLDPRKHQAAAEHLRQAGLHEVVSLHTGDARALLGSIAPAQPFDFVFFDAVKEQSEAYLEAVLPKLAHRAVLVTDNTTTHPEQLGSFVRRLRSLDAAVSCDAPVGNGFELTLYSVQRG
jgi:predicted O-methyltransferase YrrM